MKKVGFGWVLSLVALLGLFGCAQENDGPLNALEGRAISVVVDGAAVDVDLGDVATVLFGDVKAVRLGDVLRQAGVDPAEGGYLVDLVSEDGFHPATRTPCKGLVPIAVEMMDKAYIAEFTGETLWNATLDYPGCMSVGGLATVVLYSEDKPGLEVLVGEGDDAAVVDLRFLPPASEGTTDIALKDLVAGVLESPDAFRYDLEDSTGHRPGRDGGAQLLTLEELGYGLVSVPDKNVTFTGDKVGEQWALTGLVRIIPESATAAGKTVQVVAGFITQTVDLGGLPTTDVAGLQLVALSEVVEGAGVQSGGDYSYRLVASDGFDPVDVKGAALVTWEQMQKGYIDPATRDVTWDASLGMAGYWNIGDLAEIRAE